MMPSFLFDKLREEGKSFPDLQFAFSGSVNWIRALKIGCSNINSDSLNEFYANIQEPNNYSKIALASLFSSINFLCSLNSFNAIQDRKYIYAHLAIIGWYYSIYNSAQAMIFALDNSSPETHTLTAQKFYELAKNKKVLYPFNYFLEDLRKDSVDQQLSIYLPNEDFGRHLSSNYFPSNESSSKKCLLAYLNGTSQYSNRETEEKLKGSKEFKRQELKDFKKKEARRLRDAEFKKKKVSFIHQAFRFRGKANYRDCLYFFENQSDKRLNDFFIDLQFVAHKFLLMASTYVSKRLPSKEWKNFKDSLDDDYKIILNEDYLESLK